MAEKPFPLTFVMEHLLQGLYGAEVPAGEYLLTTVAHVVSNRSEAERLLSQPTGDHSTSYYQLASNCQTGHPMMTAQSKYQHNDARPASAIATMSPATHETVGTELASSMSSLDARRDAIRQQMVELNRQRLLAQTKIDELRLQEQQFTQQVSLCCTCYIGSCDQICARITYTRCISYLLYNLLY